MNRYQNSNSDRRLVSPRQRGGLTMFTAIFVLFLMTLLLVYATRVGVFEQRTSANDMRQKLAFHAAEAGLDYGFEFLSSNVLMILSRSDEAAPDGANNDPPTYRPGWFSDGNIRWLLCPDAPGMEHPCGGQPDFGDGDSFYYDADGVVNTDGAYDTLPLAAGLLTTLLPDGVTGVQNPFRVTAVLCARTQEDPRCQGWDGVPLLDDEDAEPAWTAFLLAYGYSDCNDDDASGEIDLPEECRGRAHVTRAVGSIDAFSGTPTVPLVSRNTLPTSGNSEVVPNPNGGGQGVPTSIWSNSNSGQCSSGLPAYPRNPDGTEGGTIEVASSFTTCEMHEWYEVDTKPESASCPHSSRQQCGCEYPGPEPLSYNHGTDSHIDIDIIQDAAFPCDLFEFYWGVEGFPTEQYQSIKELATVIYDCGALTPGHTGFYWFEGDVCTLNDVGTSDHPVLLISAADIRTTINGNTDFYGILYLANVEDPEQDACFRPGGGATVYGAVIVDVLFCSSKLAGTFSIVYNGGVLNDAGGFGGLGGLAGSWRDFGLPEFPWKPLP